MKRSNIIIICTVLLTITWYLICGWLEANTYNILKEGKTCSYAKIIGHDIVKPLPSFKNIKVDFDKKAVNFEKYAMSPMLLIQYGKRPELSCSKSVQKAFSFRISGDTLYLRIKKILINHDNNINNFLKISIPLLNSVNLSSDPNDSTTYNADYVYTTISGFNAYTLSIINHCQYNLRLDDNKLNKLELKGEFYNKGKAEILNYLDYDSLNVDIEGKHGTLIIESKNRQAQENSKQWINIKVPASFRVQADASLTSKIIFKK